MHFQKVFLNFVFVFLLVIVELIFLPHSLFLLTVEIESDFSKILLSNHVNHARSHKKRPLQIGIQNKIFSHSWEVKIENFLIHHPLKFVSFFVQFFVKVKQLNQKHSECLVFGNFFYLFLQQLEKLLKISEFSDYFFHRSFFHFLLFFLLRIFQPLQKQRIQLLRISLWIL